MTSRKLKSIGVLLLSIIFIATSCLFSASLAITSYSSSMNIAEGKYYIQNKDTSLYMGSVNSSIVQSSRNASVDLQKWELEYVSGGYYRIKNIYSGKYLTAPNVSTAGTNVTEQTLSSANNAQLWNFTPLESGQFALYKEYKIAAKTHENTTLALASDEYVGVEGCAVVQDRYILDLDYYDEWVLIPIKEASLVGISTTSSSHDHTSVLYNINNDLNSKFYDVNFATPTSITSYNLRTYMINSDIFVLRADGGCDELGTYVYIDGSYTTWFHAWNIYNYNGNSGIDMSGCELAVFAGCETATGLDQSLPDAAVKAGATYAIGFETDPACSEISAWTEMFIEAYTDGVDIDDAAFEAASNAGDDMMLYDYWVFQ